MQRFEWLVGLRYARASRKGFISFISLVSVLGITLGVAALIIVLSVMNGFQEEMRQRILGATAHLEVSGYDHALLDWQTLAKQLKRQPDVVGSAPYISGQALISTGNVATGSLIRGIIPEQEPQVSDFNRHIIQGQFLLKPSQFHMILGSALAQQLGVIVGDKVSVITPQGQVTPAGMLPRMKQFTVSGIFQMDAHQYDAGLALIHLDDAQKLYRLPEMVSGLRVKLTDLFRAPTVARELTKQMPDYLFIDWTQHNANYFRAVQIEKKIMAIILTLIIAVAAFNLVATLVMVVTDKKADIAILRTLGAPARSIMRIFMLQGALSGFIGTSLGTLFGVLVAKNIDVIVPTLEKILGLTFLAPEIYFIAELPSRILLSDIITIASISLILSFLATLYPSLRAARLQPAEALRYE